MEYKPSRILFFNFTDLQISASLQVELHKIDISKLIWKCVKSKSNEDLTSQKLELSTFTTDDDILYANILNQTFCSGSQYNFCLNIGDRGFLKQICQVSM